MPNGNGITDAWSLETDADIGFDWVGAEVPFLPDNTGEVQVNGHKIRVKGTNRLEQVSHRKYGEKEREFTISSTENGTFNAKKEAAAMFDGFLDDMFKRNGALTENDAEDIFVEQYVEPIITKLNSIGDKKYSHLRRNNKEKFKPLEVIRYEYPSLYKSALNRKLGKDVIFLYGLADGKKLCSAEKAYRLFESSAEYNILVDLVLNNALGDNSQDAEELFRQDVTLTDHAAYQRVLSDLEGRKLIDLEEKNGVAAVKMTEAGVRAYNLGKIIPYGVGLDLTTSILESIYGGAKTRADITGMFPASEPYRAIDSAINSLEGMNFISVRNDRVQITPGGIAAYEGVVKRILKDVEGHSTLYNDFRSTAMKLGIKVGDERARHPDVGHSGQRDLSIWQGTPAKLYSAQ